jgi:hypothetical protein
LERDIEGYRAVLSGARERMQPFSLPLATTAPKKDGTAADGHCRNEQASPELAVIHFR